MNSALLLLLLFGAAPAPPAQVELLPKDVAPDRPLPLVIALHGRGGDAEGFGRLALRLAGRARVVSLQAPEPFASGYSWFDVRLGEPDPRLAPAIAEQVARVRERIAAIRAATPSCGSPVIVGYSQGGAIALGLAAAETNGARYVVLAGTLPPDYPVRASTARIFALHATDDALVPFSLAKQALDRLGEAGAQVSLLAQQGGHSPSAKMRGDAAAALREALQQACPKARYGRSNDPVDELLSPGADQEVPDRARGAMRIHEDRDRGGRVPVVARGHAASAVVAEPLEMLRARRMLPSRKVRQVRLEELTLHGLQVCGDECRSHVLGRWHGQRDQRDHQLEHVAIVAGAREAGHRSTRWFDGRRSVSGILREPARQTQRLPSPPAVDVAADAVRARRAAPGAGTF